MAKTEIKPYSDEGSKRVQVEKMFDSISHRYDFLNHFLSFGVDHLWRKATINELRDINPKYILDVATGTGDLAFEAMKLEPKEIMGIDISENMLDVAREKVQKRNITQIKLQREDSTDLSFADDTFDAVTVAFGIRNFEDLEKGLAEMLRVVRKDGKVVILEFSKPAAFPVKQFYAVYNKYILPLWGKLFSGSSEAYKYLPESVKHFPEGLDLLVILKNCGYNNLTSKRLTFGICTIYTGIK